MSNSLAWFITPHGFGHASRACAVMSALLRRDPSLRFEIFTLTPEWVFRDSIGTAAHHHSVTVDVGLVQENPFQADLAATLQRLGELIPYRQPFVEDLARLLNALDCRMVVCDVAALGIEAAHLAGLPSVLIENFTWDWIYEAYLPEEPRFAPIIHAIREANKKADFRIQTDPLCDPVPDATLRLPPMSRQPRHDRDWVRARLGIPSDQKAVLITTGGIAGEFPFLDQLQKIDGVSFILPGASQDFQTRGNLILMPHHSDFFHPDLTHAVDAVIGKAGYSTIAEVYHAGVPFGYVNREGFREAAALQDFIEREMQGFAISEAAYPQGDWVQRVPELLALPKIKRTVPNGADLAAEFILKRL